jgi:hypothetical protein
MVLSIFKSEFDWSAHGRTEVHIFFTGISEDLVNHTIHPNNFKDMK